MPSPKELYSPVPAPKPSKSLEGRKLTGLVCKRCRHGWLIQRALETSCSVIQHDKHRAGSCVHALTTECRRDVMRCDAMHPPRPAATSLYLGWQPRISGQRGTCPKIFSYKGTHRLHKHTPATPVPLQIFTPSPFKSPPHHSTLGTSGARGVPAALE